MAVWDAKMFLNPRGPTPCRKTVLFFPLAWMHLKLEVWDRSKGTLVRPKVLQNRFCADFGSACADFGVSVAVTKVKHF